MLQVALTTLLKYWGTVPNAILDSSVGEVAAIHCAGVISLEDAVKVIHCQSRLQAEVVGGKMVVEALPQRRSQRRLSFFP